MATPGVCFTAASHAHVVERVRRVAGEGSVGDHDANELRCVRRHEGYQRVRRRPRVLHVIPAGAPRDRDTGDTGAWVTRVTRVT